MATFQHAAFVTASALCSTYVGDAGYGLAYGSHPAGTATPRSDLDLVLIGPQALTLDELTRLIDAVRHLHHVHGLDLDTEVDYSVKVHASFADVDAATCLRCFDLDSAGHITASPVIVEPWFLNSRTFAHRLLLNALTSPHAFLGGDVTAYEQDRQRAEYGLVLLALALHGDATSLTLDEAVTAVTNGPEQATGKNFLGYTSNPHLTATLRRGLGWLAQQGIVRDIDGTQFEPDHGACQAEVRQLRAARRPRATAWDNAL